jgi:hypothetical protein
LAGEAMPLLAAVTKALNPRQGDADRISVVAMRREGGTGKAGLDALDAVASESDPDARPLLARIAQAFKTPVAVGG